MPVDTPVENAVQSATQLRVWHRYATTANVIAQTGIIITGAIVRVTSSGLGCPTWPECVEGSITPTSAQTEAWHKYVEFGNRMLTGVLVIVAVLTILAMVQHNRSLVLQRQPKNKSLTRLAIACFAGIFVQAILGGITVLTGLNPLTVAGHFLVSIVLVAIAYKLWWLFRNEPSAIVKVPPLAKRATFIHLVSAVIVIVLGTLVTGSGPHAGDSADITRLPFDPRIISWIHADAVLLFIGLSIGLVIAFAINHQLSDLRIRAVRVVLVALGQGLIGYVQYFTHLPWVLVALHVAGACVLWLVTLNLFFAANQRINGSMPTARNNNAK